MKSQYMALILSMSALAACGGGGGGTTEPTTPQPTTPTEQSGSGEQDESVFLSLNTK